MIRRAFIITTLICMSLLVRAQDNGQLDLDRIQRATVLVIQTQQVGDTQVITCMGSGTIVRYDGLILTNAHNTVQSANCPGDILIIAMNVQVDEPPIIKYRAEITQVDDGLDLALLQINREVDGRLIDLDNLPPLPFVELSDSSQLSLDQNITIVGFPNFANEAIGVVRGTITAFIDEPRGGWIKTRAVVPGGMSGGGAYDSQGRLIGVPTTVSFVSAGGDSRCQILEDTNQDGFINNNDICVPVGDFISTLRPANFARPLIQGASLDLKAEMLTVPQIPLSPIDAPTASRLFFSPAIVDGLPTTVVGSLPANTNSLYLLFDYANMTSETVYELRVTRDGLPDQTYSLPPVRWSGGSSGMWYIGSEGQSWANGTYEFRLLINGFLAREQRIVIGGPPDEASQITNIVFGLQDFDGNLWGTGYVLPTGSIVSARFIFRNMEDGLTWSVRWYYNGAGIASSDDTWVYGQNGSNTIQLRPESGLFPGNYRVEIYIEDGLSATSDFVVVGAQDGPLPAVITDLHFTTASSPQEAFEAPIIQTFSESVNALYVLFDWQQMTAGVTWTVRWLVDGIVFSEQVQPWVARENGENFLIRLSAPNFIPDGTYTVEILINNLLIDSATATVGIGQLPIDRFAQAQGTQLTGTIVDAETGTGIPNVTFILISEDFSIEDFIWEQEQVYALATTDRNGNFRVDRPLALEAPYSVLIAADGYLPLSVDGFEVTQEDGNSVDIYLEMVRD